MHKHRFQTCTCLTKNPCHYKFVNSTNVNAGNVSAATIPIMPNVINTSAKVKPLDQPLDVTPSPTGVRLAFRSPTPATLSHEERAIISLQIWVSTPTFLPLSDINLRAPPPQRLLIFHTFCLLLNLLTKHHYNLFCNIFQAYETSSGSKIVIVSMPLSFSKSLYMACIGRLDITSAVNDIFVQF